LNTGVTSYVTQTGYNAYGQPVYSVTSTYPMTTYVNTCTGTLVTNSDGTTSCVTQVGTSSLGYPIYAVSVPNYNF
jgi:hypothetical protein